MGTTSPQLDPVLVVDDQPLVRRAIRRMLAPPFDVLTAMGCVQAIEVLQRLGPVPAVGAVLVDQGLPDGDGLGLARRVRREWGLPVAVISGGAAPPDVGLPWIEKPFGRASLVQAVTALVRTSMDETAG